MKTRDEIYEIIMASDPRSHWHRPQEEITYYKNDVNLRFGFIKVDNEDFKEKWANKYSDPRAFSVEYGLYYCATLIDTFILVWVDGGRALLPITKRPLETSVKPLNYKIAEILDMLNTLDEYMQSSGLKIE